MGRLEVEIGCDVKVLPREPPASNAKPISGCRSTSNISLPSILTILRRTGKETGTTDGK